MSRWCTRPSRSQSTPWRSAPSASVICLSDSSAKIAVHDGEAAGEDRQALLAQPGQRELADVAGGEGLLAQPREAVGGDAALGPARGDAWPRDRARALPEDATASFQPVFSKRATIVCTCSRAASSAAFIDFLSMRPSGKKRRV